MSTSTNARTTQDEANCYLKGSALEGLSEDEDIFMVRSYLQI